MANVVELGSRLNQDLSAQVPENGHSWQTLAQNALRIQLQLAATTPPEVKAYLAELQEKSPLIYDHLLRVGFSSIALGITLRLDGYSIGTLGNAAAWHDIGKLPLIERYNSNQPLDLATKAAHTILGADMLSPTSDVGSFTALAHHVINPRPEDTPYPDNIVVDEGHKFYTIVNIVSMSDRFDAATTRAGKTTGQAAQEITQAGFRGDYANVLVAINPYIPAAYISK